MRAVAILEALKDMASNRGEFIKRDKKLKNKRKKEISKQAREYKVR
jgi:hypothetical protein